MDVEAACALIVNHAREQADRCEVKSFPGYVSLHVVEQENQYWSPRLSLSLEPKAQEKLEWMAPMARARMCGQHFSMDTYWWVRSGCFQGS